MSCATPSAMPPTRPDRKAIFYSAAIFPGVGQYHQRRLAASLLYGGVGALASILFLAMLHRHGLDAIRMLRDAWTSGINPDEVRAVYGPIIKTAAFLIGVYLVNIYDVWYAWYRALCAWQAASSSLQNKKAR